MKDEEGAIQLYENIVQLKLESSDEKKYNTDVADMQGIFRIIQSVPSPKAEPFKMWLAEVGKERIAGNTRKEIEHETGQPVITSKNTIDLGKLILNISKSTENDENKRKLKKDN